jgi:hypothetical protein
VLGTIVAERLLDAVVLCLLFFVAAAGTVAVSRWVDGVVLLITAVAVAFVAISVHLGGRRFAARRPWVARALARLREELGEESP